MAITNGKLLPFRGRARGRQTTDLELLCLVSMGDNAALRDLFYRHGDLVFRVFLIDYGFDTHVAGRLVRDTFLEVCRAAGACDARHSVVGWIVRIALRVGGRVRSTRRASASAVAPHVATVVRYANGLAGEATALEKRVAALPWGVRMATVLVERERMAAEEAAGALGVKPRVIWRWVAKGRWHVRSVRVEGRAVRRANRLRRVLATGRLCPPAWALNQGASCEMTPRIGWHLSTCLDCSSELAELMQISDRLAALPSPEMGDALKNEITVGLLAAPVVGGLN